MKQLLKPEYISHKQAGREPSMDEVIGLLQNMKCFFLTASHADCLWGDAIKQAEKKP